MNSYLYSIIGIVLIGAVLIALHPEGKTSAMIRHMTKLACLLVIISPILQFFTKRETVNGHQTFQEFFYDSVIEIDDNFIQYYSENTITNIEEKLEQELFEKYNLQLSVSIKWEYVQEAEMIRLPLMYVCT